MVDLFIIYKEKIIVLSTIIMCIYLILSMNGYSLLGVFNRKYQVDRLKFITNLELLYIVILMFICFISLDF